MGAPRSFRTLFSISFLLLKPHFPRIISVLDRALSIIISQNSFGTRSLQGPSKPSRSSYQTLAPAEGGPGHPKEQGWDKGQATDPKSIPLHQRGPSQPCPDLASTSRHTQHLQSEAFGDFPNTKVQGSSAGAAAAGTAHGMSLSPHLGHRDSPDSQQGFVTRAVTSGLTPRAFPFLKDNESLNKRILQKAFCSISLK